jgi:hypothetical protein
MLSSVDKNNLWTDKSQVSGNRMRRVFKVHRKLGQALKVDLWLWKVGKKSPAKDRPEVTRPYLNYLIPGLKINSERNKTNRV